MNSTSHINLLSRGLALAGLVALVWVIYGAVDRFLPGLTEGGASGERGSVVTEAHPGGAQVGYDVNQIVQAHLFGKAEQKAPELNAANAPETKLQLSLAGLIASSDESMARAMIAVNSNKVTNYRVGDKIEGTDAVLHEIHPSNVLLARAGKLERLGMKRPGLASLSEQFAANPAPAARQ